MPFRFRLTSLLRIRAMREELEQSRLQRANAERRLQESERTAFQEQKLRSRKSFLNSEEGITGSQLHFYGLCAAAEVTAGRELQQRLDRARECCEKQSAAYQAAHRDVAVLRRLEEKLRQQHLQLQKRKDQQSLDEAFTLAKAGATRHPLPSK